MDQGEEGRRSEGKRRRGGVGKRGEEEKGKGEGGETGSRREGEGGRVEKKEKVGGAGRERMYVYHGILNIHYIISLGPYL